MDSEIGTAIRRDLDHAFGALGIHGTASALLMIVFGVLVIVFPELIAWLVGGYLILVGVISLSGQLSTHEDPA